MRADAGAAKQRSIWFSHVEESEFYVEGQMRELRNSGASGFHT